MFNFRYWLLGFGAVISLAMAGFYLNAKTSSIAIGQSHQTAVTELIQKKLDQFATISNLISRFVQEDLKEGALTRKTVEDKLRQYLRSSPNEIIFGVGVWFMPYSFDKSIKLFGPYAHRGDAKQKSKNDILTYEWETEEYNYPTQDWFKAGLAAGGESTFVDPYFDGGLAYVTNARMFFNQRHEPEGVISVDMILPQLQQMVLEQSNDDELVSILTRSGQLLAHPLKDKFFAAKKIVDGVNGQSLLNYKAEDLQSVSRTDHSEWIRSEKQQQQLGWRIVVESSEDHLYPELIRYRKSLQITFFSLWFAIAIIWRVLFIRERDKKLSEEQLEHGRSQLVHSAKMAALGEMAGGVAHEINSPLTIIIGKAHTLNRILDTNGFKNEDAKKAISKITETAERIGRIVSGLRTFSRSGENDPFTPESLQRLIEDSIALCAERFRMNGVELRISSVPSVEIMCRPTQISQVILNILSNAYDAVLNAPVKKVEIQFQMDSPTKTVSICFIDSGEGIPPAIAKNIMQPFFTTKEIGKGTGLGLSISTGIIEEHGGRLSLDTTSAQTKFVVTLPYTPLAGKAL